MSSLCFPSSPLLLPLPFFQSPPRLRLQPHYICISNNHQYGHILSPLAPSFSYISNYPSRGLLSTTSATVPSKEGTVSVINFEDLMEKDWSFLDSNYSTSKQEHNQKMDRIISAGETVETSRVLVSIGSEGFVDRLVDLSPCNLLLVVHDSLFVLAGIKEKNDKVKCWQGELIYVPEKWAPLDVVFLYFLPALPFKLEQVFGALAKHCSPGARVIISHPQGREVLEEQRKQYPEVVISDLPDRTTLQKAGADHSFALAEFLDEPSFYLTVLKFSEARNRE